jgi:hypothetical protein
VDVANIRAEIIFRDTFEEVPSWQSWQTNVFGDGFWNRFTEDEPNSYASQAHGDLSFFLKDPDSTSYANATQSVSIPDTADEYMIEFYFWVPSDSTVYSHFPLLVPQHVLESDPDTVYDTDISIFLDQSGDSLVIQVDDSIASWNNVALLDTTNRWYKFQIHRKDSVGIPLVDFYLNGDLKGQFNPLSPSKLTNQIRVGTTDSSNDGEGFWDDVIVTTPPTGKLGSHL